MGEYEDRYPEAYRRGAPAAPPAREEVRHPAPPRQLPDRPLFRSRFGLGAAAETAPAWQHTPNEPSRAAEPSPARMVEPTAPPRRTTGTYRGIGPRGYVRSPERIYEDICDRLTENPFVDASDIEVGVSGTEVTLAGSVDTAIALRQAEEIADEVAGVSLVHNRLTVRATGGSGAPTPGDQVNRAMGTGPAR